MAEPTAAIERAGIKTVRWPADADTDACINLSVNGGGIVTLTEHQADEALEQLAYIRRRQVMPRG